MSAKTVTAEFVCGNLGRESARQALEAYKVVDDLARRPRVDAVLLLEIGEGDSYDDKQMFENTFTDRRWDRHAMKTRNPLVSDKRHGVRQVEMLRAGAPVAHWNPPRWLNAEYVRALNTWFGSNHLAAGAWGGDRPPAARDDLRESWLQGWVQMVQWFGRLQKNEQNGVHFADMNPGQRDFTVKDLHPRAVSLFRDNPDLGIALPRPGWVVDDYDVEERRNPIEPGLHQIRHVTVVFKEKK